MHVSNIYITCCQKLNEALYSSIENLSISVDEWITEIIPYEHLVITLFNPYFMDRRIYLSQGSQQDYLYLYHYPDGSLSGKHKLSLQ